jgi:hypothetical protein
LALAVVTWAWAAAIVASSPSFLARVRLALAAFRLAYAVSTVAWVGAGSIRASSWPWATVSPTWTAMAVTVPLVAKSAVAVLADWTEPDADTVAVTAPWVTGTVRPALVVVGVVWAVAVTRW